MPIVRTFQCGDCFHRLELTLTADQWDDPPPPCPECQQREMRQQFKPVAINGSHAARAAALAEDIAAKDYGVADMKMDNREGGVGKVRYKDQTQTQLASTWGSAQAVMQKAMALGRETRIKHGTGLDVLQHVLKTGAQPDLIEASKRRAMRVW